MYMKELELNFIPKNKNVNEPEDYARGNKLTGYSNQRKQKLIELVNSDRKEKAKNLLSTLQKDIFLEIVNLYNNGKNYEHIIGVTSDFLAERLNIQEKTITEELRVIEEKSFLIGEPETYWATPFNRETGILGKKETIKTHVWKITENGKKLAIALLGHHKIKW